MNVNEIKDMQGFNVEVGNAYQWVFAMPGPDVTLLKITDIKSEDEIMAHDLYFGFDIKVKAKYLFRPVKGGWDKQDAEAIKKHGASFGGIRLK